MPGDNPILDVQKRLIGIAFVIAKALANSRAFFPPNLRHRRHIQTMVNQQMIIRT